MFGVGTEGYCQRTRDRSRDNEPIPDHRTPTQKAADFFFAKHMQEQAAKNAEEQRIQREHREKIRHQQIEQDRVNRRAEFESAEIQITAVFDKYGLTEGERAGVEEKIFQHQLWSAPMKAVEFATVEALRISVERPKPQVIPWGLAEIED